jgi:hypothetical protein
MKGALVELCEPFLGPIPNIIVFQYNPETISRTLSPWQPPKAEGEEASETDATAQPGDPGETFTLKLELDATDALEEPESHPVAVLSGVGDRLAAIEMLMFPTEMGALESGLMSLLGGGVDTVPRGTVPIVLFIWGPGRILPVRVTSFKVDEEAYSPLLQPIRATVTLELTVLTEEAISKRGEPLTMSEELAIEAYRYTKMLRQKLAQANILNTAESILQLLSF